MFFKNAHIFRFRDFNATIESLHTALSKMQYVSIGASDIESIGWVPPRNDGLLAHSVNKQFLAALKVTSKILPSAVINQAVIEKAKELEQQQGFACGRKAMKALKERTIDELLPRAFARDKLILVWLDPVNQLLAIDTSSPTVADLVIKMLLKCDKFPLESLRVTASPQAAMTDWLAGGEAPKGFTIDQDTELRAHTEDKATVRYMRHSIDPDDVQRHIAAGKQCTKLALTWDDKISFVLSENLAIKRIKPLDILNEDKESRTADENERFDADFVLMTSELAQMIDDLIYALGGEATAALTTKE